MSRPSLTERFWAKVAPPDAADCWLWTGGRTAAVGGYGHFRAGERKICAHRVAYELLVGPIPEGCELDHLCRVRLCVNPAHLEPVTHHENWLRGESFQAINARKTHCKNGHPLTPDNLCPSSLPRRRCLLCTRERGRIAQRRYRAAKRAAAPTAS